MHFVFICVYLCFPFYIWCQDSSLEIRILQPLVTVLPGQISQVQVEIINYSCYSHILVGHLELPCLWEAVPSNDVLLHITAGQRSIQTLSIKAPESASSGEYEWVYQVFARDNPSFLGRDKGFLVMGKAETSSPLSLEVTSETVIKVNTGDIIYLTAMATNCTKNKQEDVIQLILPSGWQCFPGTSMPLVLDEGESKLLIYGIKVPAEALAGEHALTLKSSSFPDCKQSIIGLVTPKIAVTGVVDGLHEVYNVNQLTPLYVKYTNQGNVPIKAVLETQAQPDCELKYSSEPFEIQPGQVYEIPITVVPEVSEFELNQFLLVKLLDVVTGEQLYQNPMTLKFILPGRVKNERYLYLPGYFKSMILGDRDKLVLAGELAGAGLLDPEKERYVDFVFRAPTTTDNIIYQADERLFLGLYDPKTELSLGDTVYELSPLTQRFRYGRGIEVDRYEETWEGGIHYTQNIQHSDQNPKEFCSYIQYNPDDDVSLSFNYMNKTQSHESKANILSFRSLVDYPYNFSTDIEVGKNFSSSKNRASWAYRLEAHGSFWNNSWFSFEKAYAGSEFFGYYNNLHLLSSSLDTPLCDRWRLNLNVNYFKQDISCHCRDEEEPTIPRQFQYYANLSYHFNSQSSISLNTLWLKGDDLGEQSHYDFFQKWVGCSFFICNPSYNLNAILSFGRQKDYLKHKTIAWLQRYYVYLGKEFSPKLRLGLFYDSGNINYYDPKPWAVGYGGALTYRFHQQGCLELFAQRIKHTTDKLNLSQFTCNFNYTFKNFHRLEAMAQAFFYKSHYPNEALFMVTYTIPFEIPIGRRTDIGDLSGEIYDVWHNVPVAEAILQFHQGHETSDAEGRFDFVNVPCGEQALKTMMLPGDLITVEKQDLLVCVPGGSKTEVSLPVVPACSLQGKIMLYGYEDLFSLLIKPDGAVAVPLHGMSGMRVAIARNGEDEIYTTMTDQKGVFEFSKIRPGHWHIKIFKEEMPSFHELDMNDLIVEILPKECKQVEFKIKPIAPQVYKLN